MALYSKDEIREMIDDPLWAAREMQPGAQKYRFTPNEMRPEDAFQIVRDELMLDGNARQNLATFVQTYNDPWEHKLMNLSISKNLIDKDEYPQSAELERRCVAMLSDLWNSPAADDTIGTSAIGSSEACMLGGMAMLWRWKLKRQAQQKPTDKPNLVTGPVQVCWEKFARYWGIELRQVPMAPGRVTMSPETMLERIDENTIGVVPTFGVTFTGQYEFPQPLCEALDRLQQEKGLDIDLHVDAASGGFLAPFVTPDLVWDFRLPRVKSISASGHKFGLAPVGAGWVVWRDKSQLPKDLIFYVNYLGGEMPTFQINFSRPAGQIICQYYEFLRLGREGYRRVQSACYAVAEYLAAAIEPLGPFEVIYRADPRQGIPALTFAIKNGAQPGYTLFDLAERLRTRGWLVPAYTLEGGLSDVAVMRIICRRGLDRDLAELLVADYRREIDHLNRNPTQAHVDAKSGTAFHHA